MSENVTSSITGVDIKLLKSFPDDRGFFREIFRAEEPIFHTGKFAQWSHSRMTFNTVKAWHFHHKQTDWWYIGTGDVTVGLYDNRDESPTYKKLMTFNLGEANGSDKQYVVKIPPGVLHGLKVTSEKADLFYITSEIYDPNDEGRIPYNSPDIPYDWGKDVITVERDRNLHIPPYDRVRV